MTSLPARNTQNSYSDAVARNFVGWQCQSLVSAVNVGLCVMV